MNRVDHNLTALAGVIVVVLVLLGIALLGNTTGPIYTPTQITADCKIKYSTQTQNIWTCPGEDDIWRDKKIKPVASARNK